MAQKSSENLSILNGIFFTYRYFLNSVVFFSSVFFTSWIILLYAVGFKESVIFSFIAAFIIFIFRINIKNSRLAGARRATEFFVRIITITGSIIFMFLFFNSVMRESGYLVQQFLKIGEFLEVFLNVLIFKVFVTLLFVIIYLVSAFFVVKFANNKIREIRGQWSKMFFYCITTLIILVTGIYFVSNTDKDVLTADTFSYFQISWIFGISLAVLHFHYLIRELFKLFIPGGVSYRYWGQRP